MVSIYKSINPSSSKVFTSQEELEEVPEGYVEATKIYHVSKVKKTDDPDYSVKHNGVTRYFRFTSESGRIAQKIGGMVPKVTNKDAVTNPDCLQALGIETFDLMAEIQRVEDKRAEKELLIESQKGGSSKPDFVE